MHRFISSPRRSRTGWRVAVALAALTLVGTGCGSTLSDDQLNAQAAETFNASFAKDQPTPAVSAAAPADRSTTAAGTGTPGATSAEGTSTAAAAGTAPSIAASTAVAPPTTTNPDPASIAGGAPGTKTTRTASATGPAPAPGAAPGATTPAAPTGPKSEIVIGSFGIETGVVGAIMLPVVQAARVWAADVNARGGLNGHPVRLIMANDEGDPNKTASLVTRMIDQDKVVAFFGEHAPTTIQAALPILEKRRVPILGGCNCSPLTAHSPMTFQVGTGSEWGLIWAHALQLKGLSDKKKVSVFACREVAVCENVRTHYREAAQALGLEVVHEAQVTLAQPDYTAEVIAARNAGAEIIAAAIDNTAAVRMARSAHRQGYYPQIAIQYSGMDDRTLQEGAEDLDGALIGGGMPLWTSPKMADYRAAMAKYAPGGIKASIGMNVWGAGKLFEKLAATFPAQGVTSEDVLRGLYGLKGETLGGIVPPITYQEGKGTENECIIPVKVQKSEFVVPNGDTWSCPPIRHGA